MTNSFPAVTRIEVIDNSGRAFTRRYDIAGADVSLQDEGRTLKVFAARGSDAGAQNALNVPSYVELQEAVAAALKDAPALLSNPEYGGTIVDVIAGRLATLFSAKGV